MNNNKVCHLTSVHPANDIRILDKECKSLANAGYQVVLIAKNKKNETVDGVHIVPFPVFNNRFARVLFSPLRMFFLARKQKAALYHFHDPELLITGLLLRLFTRAKVVYDIHEDYRTSIGQKHYLPRPIAAAAAGVFGLFEKLAARAFVLITAEKYYNDRFPKGIQILNYPLTEGEGGPPEVMEPQNRSRSCCLLYTGGITADRGALLHAEMLNHLKNVELYMVGICRKSIAEQMRRIAGENQDRLHIEGEDGFVSPSRIRQYYEEREWLAGLAIFPPTPHYKKKELTKFFEYMGVGIPIICSDFPVWRELVEGSGAGLVVDPSDWKAIVEAVEFLKTHGDEARQMGEKGKRAVKERYNWNMEEKKLSDLYRSLL